VCVNVFIDFRSKNSAAGGRLAMMTTTLVESMDSDGSLASVSIPSSGNGNRVAPIPAAAVAAAGGRRDAGRDVVRDLRGYEKDDDYRQRILNVQGEFNCLCVCLLAV